MIYILESWGPSISCIHVISKGGIKKKMKYSSAGTFLAKLMRGMAGPNPSLQRVHSLTQSMIWAYIKVPIVLKKYLIVPFSYYFHRIPHELSDFAVIRLRKRHLLLTVNEQKNWLLSPTPNSYYLHSYPFWPSNFWISSDVLFDTHQWKLSWIHGV